MDEAWIYLQNTRSIDKILGILEWVLTCKQVQQVLKQNLKNQIDFIFFEFYVCKIKNNYFSYQKKICIGYFAMLENLCPSYNIILQLDENVHKYLLPSTSPNRRPPRGFTNQMKTAIIYFHFVQVHLFPVVVPVAIVRWRWLILRRIFMHAAMLSYPNP